MTQCVRTPVPPVRVRTRVPTVGKMRPSRKQIQVRLYGKRGKIVDFIEQINQSTVEGLEQIAESDLFAIYAVGGQTYLLVQRHKGTPWMALRLSGDGLFRISSLLGDAMRHLYRDVSAHLSPNYLTEGHEHSRRIGNPDDLPHDERTQKSHDLE